MPVTAQHCLWKCRAEVGIRNADKLGCRVLTTIEQLDLPVVTTTQRCAFAVLVAKQVYKDAAFNKVGGRLAVR